MISMASWLSPYVSVATQSKSRKVLVDGAGGGAHSSSRQGTDDQPDKISAQLLPSLKLEAQKATTAEECTQPLSGATCGV